jgi:hypothetical protein
MHLCMPPRGRSAATTKKGPARGPSPVGRDLGELGDQPTAETKAATTDEPMVKIRAGAIRSKNLARDMTHTFELEPPPSLLKPLEERRICYLNSD